MLGHEFSKRRLTWSKEFSHEEIQLQIISQGFPLCIDQQLTVADLKPPCGIFDCTFMHQATSLYLTLRMDVTLCQIDFTTCADSFLQESTCLSEKYGSRNAGEHCMISHPFSQYCTATLLFYSPTRQSDYTVTGQ